MTTIVRMHEEPLIYDRTIILPTTGTSGLINVDSPFPATYVAIINQSQAVINFADGALYSQPVDAIPVQSNGFISTNKREGQHITIYWTSTAPLAANSTVIVRMANEPIPIQAGNLNPAGSVVTIGAGNAAIGSVTVTSLPTIAELGTTSDAAIFDPTLTATENALLKGLLKQLQGSGQGNAPITANCNAGSNGGTNYKLVSAATTNATPLKATAGRIHSIIVTNTSAAMKYLKLYNKASAPVVGTDVPIMTIGIPTLQTLNPINADFGLYFSAGIAFATTGLGTDADATAVALNDLIINMTYA